MVNRVVFWDESNLPTVAITRWNGKGFTSVEIIGDDRESLGIFVVSKLSEATSPAKAVRVIHRAGFITPTTTQPAGFIIDAYGPARALESTITDACLEWRKEKQDA